ncbi:EamA family transporter [Devosia sp. SL43]|uniref:EamA family transporter n=1 Tax=Devosia sp. SL43 TaxID=2806348 RepID=UPI001EFFE83A|nr:EamA family transporter [Devosia sp. SL43]UJW85905.1 EamA family transporter [Devosia sp. SL43]
MSPLVIGLALFAAIMHATWNAFLRSGADRLWTVTVMSFSGTIIAIPFAFVFPLPASAAWPYIVLSSALQVGYTFFLVAAYRQGQLGQVYPIVRGTAPLLVTLGTFLLTGLTPTPLQAIGVTMVAVGIMSLALGRGRASWTSLAFAFTTGVIVASYGTVDSIGVHVAEHAGAYAAWVFIGYGTLLPLAFLVARRKLVVNFRATETHKALGGGIVALFAYGLVVVAFSMGPAGPITALRETSVVFAILIGWLFLGEKLTAPRIVAGIVVAIGAICLGYGG